MSKKIVLVSCSKEKLAVQSKAKDIYMPSAYFRKMRAYAEKFSDIWFILSAKHHLLNPETIINPYNVTLRDFNKEQRRLWASRILVEITPLLSFDDEIEIIAGWNYVEFLIEPLQRISRNVFWPVQGKGIGQQMNWLDDQVDR